MKEKKERLIVESKSEAALIKRLREDLVEAQRKIGQQQILIDYKDKLIEIAEEHYKIDIKKTRVPGHLLVPARRKKAKLLVG